MYISAASWNRRRGGTEKWHPKPFAASQYCRCKGLRHSWSTPSLQHENTQHRKSPAYQFYSSARHSINNDCQVGTSALRSLCSGAPTYRTDHAPDQLSPPRYIEHSWHHRRLPSSPLLRVADCTRQLFCSVSSSNIGSSQ